MAKYDFRCPEHGLIELRMTYAEFDAFDNRCPQHRGYPGDGPNPCGEILTRDYSDSPPVATFYGSDFTRRSTDTRQNLNIDHWDKRGTQSYPGDPKKGPGITRDWV